MCAMSIENYITVLNLKLKKVLLDQYRSPFIEYQRTMDMSPRSNVSLSTVRVTLDSKLMDVVNASTIVLYHFIATSDRTMHLSLVHVPETGELYEIENSIEECEAFYASDGVRSKFVNFESGYCHSDYPTVSVYYDKRAFVTPVIFTTGYSSDDLSEIKYRYGGAAPYADEKMDGGLIQFLTNEIMNKQDSSSKLDYNMDDHMMRCSIANTAMKKHLNSHL